MHRQLIHDLAVINDYVSYTGGPSDMAICLEMAVQ
jgi:hypothetical protein